MADDPIQILKPCSKCGREKPATIGYFRSYKYRDKTLLRNRCRLCEGLKREGIVPRTNGLLTPEEKQEKNRLQCRAYYSKHKEILLTRVREKRKENPDKIRERDRKYNKKNKGAGSEYQKRRYARLDKKAAREAVRKWQRENPDKVYAMWRRTYEKNKTKIIAYGIKWAKENPEARAAIMNRRRAKQFGAGGDYNKDDVREMLRVYGRVCFYCSTQLKKFHVDHFIPLARGGSNAPDNLRLSCPSCNYSKAARMPWDWMPQKFEKPQCEVDA